MLNILAYLGVVAFIFTILFDNSNKFRKFARTMFLLMVMIPFGIHYILKEFKDYILWRRKI